MSGTRWSHYSRRPGGLYRDRENGWIFGVCAGVAEYFGFRVCAVRLITAVALLLFFWPTVLTYGVATLLLREKPLIFAGRTEEYEFWRRRETRDDWSRS